MRASFRPVSRVYADSASGGRAYRPVWENIQAKVSAGECPTEREWYLLALENGRSEQEASNAAREIVAEMARYRASILAEASGREDVLSLLRTFRLTE